MKLSLSPAHLKRYADLARLLIKYGRKDVLPLGGVDEAALSVVREESGAAPAVANDSASPEDLARELEALGPTYIKIGQFLSTRADLLPQTYLDALSRLQDDVKAVPFAEIEKIVQEELGVRLSKGFAAFDVEPIAAASLSQVHRAELRDGRVVAVKVQRPGIRQVVLDDLEAFDAIVELVDANSEAARRYSLRETFQSFRNTLLRELDFNREANNLDELAAGIERYPRIVVPRPIRDYTTSRVLTMTHMQGSKISAVSRLARLELDGTGLIEELTRAYLDQVLVHGFFHADPHPGNVLLTDDSRLALIDVGQTARLSPAQRERLMKLLLAAADGNVDDVVEVLVQLGGRREDYDATRFHHRVTDLLLEHRNDKVGEVPLGRVMMALTSTSVECGVRPSPELSLLGKALLHLDEVGRVLDPGFNPRESIRAHSESLMRRHLLKQLKPGRIFSTILEANEFVRALPQRLNRLLESLSSQQFEVKVRTVDDGRFKEVLQQASNRLAVAIVLAALILGAAMLMRVDTPFRIHGYPGFAILLFALAAVLGFGLVIHVLITDVRQRRKT